MKKIDKNEKHILSLRKRFLLGIMDILILQWVKKQPLCGRDIADNVQREFGMKIGPGTLYPILYQMQKKGLIDSKAYCKKRMYFLTKKGMKVSAKANVAYFRIQKSILGFLK